MSLQTYATKNTNSKNPVLASGKAIVAIIHAAWSCGLSLWKNRHEGVHQRQEQGQSLSIQQIQHKVSMMYDSRWSLPQHAHETLFTVPMGEMKTKSRDYLDWWIDQVSPILKKMTGTHQQEPTDK